MPQAPLTVNTVASRSTIAVNAATVIKATPGRLRRIVIQAAGSAGNFVINDCATTAAAATSNQIATIAFNATGVVAGMPIVYDWPCQAGIVVSSVTTAGVIDVAWD